MKVLFLVRRIRRVDALLLLVWVVPFAVNLVYFNLIKGGNELWMIFCPFGSIFRGSLETGLNAWGSWYGAAHMCALALTVFARVTLALKLWERMKSYQRGRPGFRWNPRDRFWYVVCVPFVSFAIYPILLKMTKFELVHKYNL